MQLYEKGAGTTYRIPKLASRSARTEVRAMNPRSKRRFLTKPTQPEAKSVISKAQKYNGPFKYAFMILADADTIHVCTFNTLTQAEKLAATLTKHWAFVIAKMRRVEVDPRIIEYPREKPKPAHVPAAGEWYSVASIAAKWSMSTDKVFRTVEGYRGRKGFMDQGTKANLKTHTRRSSFIRISPELLAQMEADFQGKVS